jgi:hypothetical protein
MPHNKTSAFFQQDSVLYLRQMKQLEDPVPEQFVFTPVLKSENDSSLTRIDYRLNLISESSQQKNMMNSEFKKTESQLNFVPSIIIVISFFLIALGKSLYFRSFKQLFESLISFIKFRLWIRDTGGLLGHLFRVTTPAYFLLISLTADFLIQKTLYNDYQFSPSGYGIVLMFVVMVYGIRHFMMLLASKIFFSRLSSLEQIRNIQIHNSFLVFFLVFFLPLSIYFPEYDLYKILLPFVLIIEGIRIGKAVFSAISLRQYHLYYFFLYFCTVEIIPVFIVVKSGMILMKN